MRNVLAPLQHVMNCLMQAALSAEDGDAYTAATSVGEAARQLRMGVGLDEMRPFLKGLLR